MLWQRGYLYWPLLLTANVDTVIGIQPGLHAMGIFVSNKQNDIFGPIRIAYMMVLVNAV
jgi:hypothetical protein